MTPNASNVSSTDICCKITAATAMTWSTYEHWFAAVPFSEHDMNLPSSKTSHFVAASSSLNPTHVGSMLRFKLASNDLQICAGRQKHGMAWHGKSRLAGSESVLDASCNKWKMSSSWCLNADFIL